MTVEVPRRMRTLPVDKHHRPVPWFVAFIDGKPDHRVIKPGAIPQAHRFGLCWLCGQSVGVYKTFVVGPMCGVNRISAEPPSHRDCADYAARACPFLTTPNMNRREKGLPEGHVGPAGVMIARNPGVTLLWNTKSYRIVRDGDGILFRMGDPTSVTWLAEGRDATRWEVENSIDTGLPNLKAIAEEEGPGALMELERMKLQLMKLVPA